MKSAKNWAAFVTAQGNKAVTSPYPGHVEPAAGNKSTGQLVISSTGLYYGVSTGKKTESLKMCFVDGAYHGVEMPRYEVQDNSPDLIISGNGRMLVVQMKKLSDPDRSGAVDGHRAELAASKEMAMKFLESIGVATPDGRLTKAFGG